MKMFALMKKEQRVCEGLAGRRCFSCRQCRCRWRCRLLLGNRRRYTAYIPTGAILLEMADYSLCGVQRLKERA